MQFVTVSIVALAAVAASMLGCVVLWAWLTTLPTQRLVLLSALVVLSIGRLWLGGTD
jgi:hypothetical protein